jgi:prepilin-type N-terminal cleavage/methylation domain-containing protein
MSNIFSDHERPAPPKRQAGFTLLELLIVIICVAILLILILSMRG